MYNWLDRFCVSGTSFVVVLRDYTSDALLKHLEELENKVHMARILQR